MHLTHRLAQFEDFGDWYDANFLHLDLGKSFRDRLECEWKVIYQFQPNMLMLVEDQMLKGDNKIVAIAFTLLVSDAYAEWIKRGEEPWVNNSATRPLPDGSFPLLTQEEIRRANSNEGLIALTARYQIADWVPEAHLPDIRGFMFHAYATYYRGYKYKEILMESIGTYARDRALSAGYRERTDFSRFYGSQFPPEGKRPFIMGITSEEAKNQESIASLIISYTPPLFAFTDKHKDLLIATLAGMGEKEYMETRGLEKADRVGGMWRQIHDKVEKVDPDFFPPMVIVPGEPKRGRDKKERLLQYLRDHPEELRPTLNKRRGSQ